MEESLSARSPAGSRLLLDVEAEGGATKPSVPGALRIQTTGKRLPVIWGLLVWHRVCVAMTCAC